jgi:hypothetical protein
MREMSKATGLVSVAAAAVLASSATAMDTAVRTPHVAGRTTATLNFYGFPNYYGYMDYYQGYGGFNFYGNFLYMNASTWTNPNGPGYQNGWCDTGYQNEAAMSAATSLGVIYQYGMMESASTHSFTLDSMNVAASFSKNAVWHVISYVENNNVLYQKADDKLKVSFTGEHVKLATLGNPYDFTHVVAVAFQLHSYGRPGDKCTYGYPIVGAQLALGDVKVTWSRKADLPENRGRLLTPYLLSHQPLAVPHVTAEHQSGETGQGAANTPYSVQYHHDSAGHDPGSQLHPPP